MLPMQYLLIFILHDVACGAKYGPRCSAMQHRSDPGADGASGGFVQTLKPWESIGIAYTKCFLDAAKAAPSWRDTGH
jgi:hypothetical protein